jgi:SAM-dependent methyltransferase
VYLFLQRRTDIFGGTRKKVLHVAPEKTLATILQRHAPLSYLSADLNSESVMVKMDVTDIQFPDAHFDTIICNHVLEHVDDDVQAMRELYRTLKPGGWAVLQVPLSPSLEKTYEDPSVTTKRQKQRIFGQRNHVRIYGLDYRERLESAGFDVDVFRWSKEAEEFGGWCNRFGLDDNEPVFLANKR